MVEPAIRIRSLYKIFGARDRELVAAVRAGMGKAELLSEHRHVLGLKDINIDMPKGGIQVVMGLSGSGKSTLIRHINRLIEPSGGEIVIDGENVLAMSPGKLRDLRRHKISMVFQRFGLLPHKTIYDNVVYGLAIQGVAADKQRASAHRWIERVGLKGYEDRYPAQLSGGMQQRVGLARALATNADILLMDEAFSALDPLIRSDMQSVLLDLQEELQKTIVFITHDLDEALRLGDRIAILRDGEIVQQGTGQEIVLKPADDYIQSFVREVNRGRVIEVQTIMEPGEAGIDGPAIETGAVIEEAARAMTRHGVSAARIVDAAGKPLGRVTLQGVIAAMVSPAEHEQAPVGA
ncbi:MULTISPECIES: quaternary amine ABC transporter ATP-binding protein [unclassified Aureimonas]|uniref:quaternary amine ABC transporter ATP-binding protein n=1 Tax=unclassified Aureimonas TaxID=2615206 RepID=UPI0006F47837|nr:MULTISPECIES: glycine betaine/L-proline ABC transporter ATP-binding protein [unclassified Aureimonas]KQT57316.1 proline/glycine betaine ABC transporter ATP-binding protein [Aureimonas sp. Leaf427]KQT76996.1 proline/glycine betaine ABC transporter ATP-binding protein [Aureimonas sp. Leaf460]